MKTSKLSSEEYLKLRKGEATQESIDESHKEKAELELAINISTKDFLIGRTKEYIKVPIASNDGYIEVSIRARLSKKEERVHRVFLDKCKDVLKGDATALDECENETAAFLADITEDNDLDIELFLSGQLDAITEQEILMAYFTEPFKRMAAVRSFRQK